jgi:hypothetical protein
MAKGLAWTLTSSYTIHRQVIRGKAHARPAASGTQFGGHGWLPRSAASLLNTRPSIPKVLNLFPYPAAVAAGWAYQTGPIPFFFNTDFRTVLTVTAI